MPHRPGHEASGAIVSSVDPSNDQTNPIRTIREKRTLQDNPNDTRQRFFAGGTELSREGFNTASGRLGFSGSTGSRLGAGEAGAVSSAVENSRITDQEILNNRASENARIQEQATARDPEVIAREEQLRRLREVQNQELQTLANRYLNADERQRAALEQANPQLKDSGFFERVLAGLSGNEFIQDGRRVRREITTGALIDAQTGELINDVTLATGALPIGPAGAVNINIGPRLLSNTQSSVSSTLGRIGKFISGGVGSVLGAGIVGQAYTLITAGRVSNLESDITALRTSTRDILTDVRDGADPVEAIETLRIIEEDIGAIELELNKAIKGSITERAKLKGSQQFMFRTLSAVVRRRQALERYLIDGDQEALNRFIEQSNAGLTTA